MITLDRPTLSLSLCYTRPSRRERTQNPDEHRGESGRPSTGGTSPLVNVDGSILQCRSAPLLKISNPHRLEEKRKHV